MLFGRAQRVGIERVITRARQVARDLFCQSSAADRPCSLYEFQPFQGFQMFQTFALTLALSHFVGEGLRIRITTDGSAGANGTIGTIRIMASSHTPSNLHGSPD